MAIFLAVSLYAGAQAINCPSGWNNTTGSCGVSTSIQTTGFPFAFFGDNQAGVGVLGSDFNLQPTGVVHAPNNINFQTAVNVQAFVTTFEFQMNTWNIAFILNNATRNAGGGPAPGFTLASGFSGGAGCEEGFYQAFGGAGNPPPNNIFVLNIDSANFINVTESGTGFFSNVQLYQQMQSPCIPDDNQPFYYPTNKVSTSPVMLSSVGGVVCTPQTNSSCVTAGGSSSPDTMSATVKYTGTTVTINLFDVTAGGSCTPVTSSTCFTFSWPNVSIPSIVDGTTAFAGFGGSSNSATPNALLIENWVYTVLSPAATPTFSPSAGTFGSAQIVTISDASSGSIICFNTTGAPYTDGNGNCPNGTKFTAPISVPKGVTLFAVAGSGSTMLGDSAVGSSKYSITGSASQPVFVQPPGTYQGAQTVALSAASGGVICFSTSTTPATNGSTGCTTGTLYSVPIVVTANETINAVAGGTGLTDSNVGSSAYVISPFAVVQGISGASPANSPTFSPVAGTYTGAQTVTLASTTANSNICYVLSSILPTLMPEPDSLGGCAVGTAYTGPVTVSSSQTLFAAAGTTVAEDVAGTGPPSSVSRAAFVINTSSPATAPSCTPTSSSSTSPITVTCSNSNSGTTIMCFTENGTTPVTNGAGTGCTTGTALTGSSNTISISSTVAALKVVAGTSTLTDSTAFTSGPYTIGTATSAHGVSAVGVKIQ
jgi:hypothetical protein